MTLSAHCYRRLILTSCALFWMACFTAWVW